MCSITSMEDPVGRARPDDVCDVEALGPVIFAETLIEAPVMLARMCSGPVLPAATIFGGRHATMPGRDFWE